MDRNQYEVLLSASPRAKGLSLAEHTKEPYEVRAVPAAEFISNASGLFLVAANGYRHRVTMLRPS